MTNDDDLLAIAARVADGTGIDWSTADSTSSEVEDLKAIAHIAALHRAPSVEARSPLSGRRWGSLTIIEEVGAGRFGRVYRAWDARLERFVALKILDAASSPPAASPLKSIDEARLLARVRHPNVLVVHGAESIDGQVGIWTEFLEGRTLERILTERGPLPPEDVVAIGLDLCRALGAVHEAGLLHRDIKAQNVMRETGGRIVLMDFGAGQDLERWPARAGDLTGTPLYLAPELFTGHPPSRATDVYALAVLLFRLLTGTYPVAGRTLDDVRAGHRVGRPTARVHDVRPETPPALTRAIEQGLAVDERRRHSNARSFEAALVQAKRDTMPARSAFGRLRGDAWRLVLASALIVGLLVGTGAYFRWRQPAPARATPGGAASAPGDRIVRLPLTPEQLGQDLGRPSHDGKYFPYVDSAGNVEIWEVATGRSRRLTDDAAADESATRTLLSPTADRVAYSWATHGGFSLRVLNTDGTWPRVLIGRETAFEPIPLDWSRDGQLILCWLKQRNGTSDLVLVPIDGTSPRVLVTMPSGRTPVASLSPDGRFAAYFADPPRPGPSARSLFMVGTERSTPRAVLDGRTGDSFPMWLSSGRGLLFLRPTASNNASFDVWFVAVSDGIVQGPPRLLTSPLGGLVDPALSDDGALLSEELVRQNELYLASIDLTGNTPIGPPARVSRTAVGQHVAPNFSPDGTSIAYFTLSPSLPGWNPIKTLTIGDVQSAAARKLDLKLDFIEGYRPQWLPDGRSLVIWAADDRSRDRFGFFRIDVTTGAATPVLILGHAAAPPVFQCSRDGQALLYVDPKRGIVRRDFSTGAETLVIAARRGYELGQFGVASKSEAIALTVFDQARNIWQVEVHEADGTRRTLGTRGDRLRFCAWTPDGRNVLVYKDTDGGAALWSYAAFGSEARDLHFSLAKNNTVELSPDGRRMAYGESDRHWDLRIRERFLEGLGVRGPGK